MLAAAEPSLAATAKRKPEPAPKSAPKAAPKVEAKPVVVTRAELDSSVQLYGDTYAVYPGLRVDTDAFRQRLEHLGYSSSFGGARRGGYIFSRGDHAFSIYLHPFDYPDHQEPGRLFEMTLDNE